MLHSVLIGVLGLSATTPAATSHQGKWEIRINTGSTLTGVLGQSGFSYNTEQKTSVLNLSGGAGYLLTEHIVVGADVLLSFAFSDANTSTLFGVVPFARYVSNLDTGGNGFFVEPGVGFAVFDATESSAVGWLFQGWAGLNVMLAENVGLQVGPSMTLAFDELQQTTAGLRVGLSTYLF